VPAEPVHTCTFQGISVGWCDIYDDSLPCQWIDITQLQHKPPERTPSVSHTHFQSLIEP